MAILTKQRLEEMLQRPVEPAHILIAKNLILGSDAESIAEMLGVEGKEIQDTMESDDYKQVYTLISADHNDKKVETNLTIDEIENRAWKNVAKRLQTKT